MLSSMTLLKDICEIQIGYQSGSRVKGVEDGPFRIIQASDITDDLRVSTDAMLRFIPERDPVRYLVGPDDVLFMSRGQRNYALQPDIDLTDTVAASYFYILRPKSNVLPGYLAWWINQPTAQAHIAEFVTGSTMPYVRRGDFELLPVDLPDLERQKVVVLLERERAREEKLLNQLIGARRKQLSATALRAVSDQG